MNLLASSVILDDSHRYWYGDKELKGITGIISRHLFPNKYDGVPESLLSAKAKVGTEIHEALDIFDEFGLVHDDYCDVVRSWEAIKEKEAIEVVVSEYIVTDYTRYASPIDKVITINGVPALLDVKTTAKLDKQYVSWQLSIYKYLFNIVNPDIEVGRLFALHVSGSKCKLVEVSEMPTDEVKRLLEADAAGSAYSQELGFNQSEALSLIGELAVQLSIREGVEAKIKEFDDKLKELLADVPPFKIDNDIFTLSKGADYTRRSFDSKAFEADNPELAEKYTKQVLVKGGIKYKLKGFDYN